MVESKRKSRAENSGPQPKRQRVSRACDQCRSAREKCDGIQPMCFTCASNNRNCTYTTNPKRRGIQPGYIRTLELTLQWTLNNVPGAEEAISELLQDEKGQALLSSNDSAASNKLHKKWRKHVVSNAIDRVLSGEPIRELFDHPMATSDDEDDDESVPEPQATQQPFLTPDSLKTGSAQFVPDDFAVPRIPELQETTQAGQMSTQPQNRASLISLPANHWRLIDVYFSYMHSWLPLASKERILKLCYSYTGEGLVLEIGRQSADHAELWSILALAAIQNRSTQPQTTFAPEAILNTSKRLACDVLDNADVGHVGALMNLCLVEVALGKADIGWILLGRAIRLGMFLRVNMDAQPMESNRSYERLQGLLLGCFVIETMLAIQLRLVPSLRTDHAVTFGEVTEDGLDEWQPWSGCDGFQSSKNTFRPNLPSQARSTFNQLVKLCYILNDRVCERLIGTQPTITHQNLSTWLSTLPPTLGPLHSMSPEQTSPQKLHLFLAFLVGRTYDVEQQNIIEEALSVLDQFTYVLGTAAMPPLFSCFLQILKKKAQDDGFQQNRLAGILTRFNTAWQGPAKETWRSPSAMDASPQTHNAASTVNTTPRAQPAVAQSDTSGVSPHDTMNPIGAIPTGQVPSLLPAQSVPPFESSTAPGQSMLPQYDTNFHIRNDSIGAHSMDLDALFDHFTSIDGSDQSGGLHPSFMQNLGFAPNANLADLMANDYGWTLDPG